MAHHFTAREIHFLKADSDDLDIKAPDTYFSDLLLKKTQPVKSFEKRLLSEENGPNQFLCAVIQVSLPPAGKDRSQPDISRTIFEDTFNAILNEKKNGVKRGIWESLNGTSFIFAFWDYTDEKKASALMVSLKDKISSALNSDIMVGIAKFPFHDFSAQQTIYNAFKAIDHAAFFGSDTLIHFDAVSLNICGDRLFHLDKHTLALNEYEKGLDIQPDNVNLLNSAGVCLSVMGNLSKALEIFEKAGKLVPDELMVVYNIGLLHKINGQVDKALVYLRKAHGIDGHVFEVELLLGLLLMKKNKAENALPHLETASEIQPESGTAFRVMGEIYLNQKNYDTAGKLFNTAIKINPEDAGSLSGYASAMSHLGKNLKIALSFARNSVALEPDNVQFQERLAFIEGKAAPPAAVPKQKKTTPADKDAKAD